MQVCRKEGAGTSWPGNGGSCLKHRKYSHRTAAQFTAGIEIRYFLLDKFHLIADRFPEMRWFRKIQGEKLALKANPGKWYYNNLWLSSCFIYIFPWKQFLVIRYIYFFKDNIGWISSIWEFIIERIKNHTKKWQRKKKKSVTSTFN